MLLQISKLIIPCLLGVIITIAVFTSTTLAQKDNSPFAVRLIPQAEEAAAGSPFNYTIVVTNVSGAPVKQAIVFVELPAGTQFVDAPSIDVNWDTSWPNRDKEGGRVLWYNPNGVVEPKAVFTFTLTVMVLDKMASKDLINQAYTFAGVENYDKTGTGPTAVVAVVTATPTPTPTSTPTPTGTYTPAPTATATTEVTVVPTDTVAEVAPTTTETPPSGGSSWPCLTGLVIIGSVLASRKTMLRRL